MGKGEHNKKVQTIIPGGGPGGTVFLRGWDPKTKKETPTLDCGKFQRSIYFKTCNANNNDCVNGSWSKWILVPVGDGGPLMRISEALVG